MASLNATACWKESADDAGDVATDIEILRVVYTDTLYTKTETAYAWQNDGLSVRQFLLKYILQFCNYTYNGTF